MRLSRNTIYVLALAYQDAFSEHVESERIEVPPRKTYVFFEDSLYDFLFLAGVEEPTCAEMRTMRYERNLQDWIMRKCADGAATPLALRMAQAAIDDGERPPSNFDPNGITSLRDLLELDGYVMRDGRLVALDGLDVVPVAQTQDAITALLNDLGLPSDLVLHHLKLSEKHFLGGDWDDSIGNSRKVLEESLKEIARALSAKLGAPLGKDDLQKPVKVRDYLEAQGILEAEEKKAYVGAYGLLSHTGGHPYIARKDQARLLRNVALTYTQFALLQWEGRRKRA